MTRTHEKVRHTPKGKYEELTPTSAADGVERALEILEGRCKPVILNVNATKTPADWSTSVKRSDAPSSRRFILLVLRG
jgi:hypothetical protein